MSDDELMRAARAAVGPEGDAGALVRFFGVASRVLGRGAGAPATDGPPAEWTAERLRWDDEPLWDTEWINGQGETRFFWSPLGGRFRVSGGPKSFADTSMLMGSRLPEPERFAVTGISFAIRPEAPAAFETWLRRDAYFELRVGGGDTSVRRETMWRAVRRDSLALAIGDADWKVPPFLPIKTQLIGLNEYFCVAVMSADVWTGEPQPLRCFLTGWHAKGFEPRRRAVGAAPGFAIKAGPSDGGAGDAL